MTGGIDEENPVYLDSPARNAIDLCSPSEDKVEVAAPVAPGSPAQTATEPVATNPTHAVVTPVRFNSVVASQASQLLSGATIFSSIAADGTVVNDEDWQLCSALAQADVELLTAEKASALKGESFYKCVALTRESDPSS
jgi:hypothetical protein